VSLQFRLARHPNRLDAKHPRLIEDLLELAKAGNQEAVDTMIIMLEDFHQHGFESRFVKKLRGLPIWELKSRSRGGQKGGARVYFFVTGNTEVALVNAESKVASEPSASKLDEVAEILFAHQGGLAVLEEIT
jgi:hypothetical protein